MPNPAKSLKYINCYSSSRPRSVKALAILWDTTVRRPEVGRKDLRQRWEDRKGQIPLTDQQFYFLQVFKRFY